MPASALREVDDSIAWLYDQPSESELASLHGLVDAADAHLARLTGLP